MEWSTGMVGALSLGMLGWGRTTRGHLFRTGKAQSPEGFAEASSLEAGGQVLETWLYFQDFENVT